MDTHTSLNYLPMSRVPEKGGFGPRGKWLVVDDDPLIRSVIAIVLEDLANISVVECNSGQVAWDAWRGLPNIEGVVTDLDMPGVNGIELAAKIHGKNPETPIILVTACAEDLEGIELRKFGIRRVISKPFSCKELVAALRETLRATNWLAAA